MGEVTADPAPDAAACWAKTTEDGQPGISAKRLVSRKQTKMPLFYAHTGTPEWQPLAEHLREVARRAHAHGAPLGLADEAELAGLLHDLGKYARRLLARLIEHSCP